MRPVQALALLAVLALPAQAEADWQQLRSGNLLVIGEVSAGELRGVALRLRRFREALSRLHPGLVDDQGAAPVVVIAFGTDGAFRPYMPREDGRTLRVDGLFQSGDDLNYIAVSLAAGPRAFSTVFHEYAHLLLNGAFGDAPVWFVEGMAEYYRTVQFTSDGRQAVVGTSIPVRLDLLRRRSLPLETLFAIDRDSAAYTVDGAGRDLLYAQAWAVVHHAFHGESARGDQLLEFATRVTAGEDASSAFRDVYDIAMADLDREIRLHVRRPVYPRRRVALEAAAAADVPLEVRPLSDARADAFLGDLLARMGRLDDADERLAAALVAAPDLDLAHGFLGLLRLRQGRRAEGLVHLERAVALGTSDLATLVGYARAVIESDDAGADSLNRAAGTLERALEVQPGHTEATLLLAYLWSVDRRNEAVRELLAPVVRREPSNHRAALQMAVALLRLGEVAQVAEARTLLDRVVARTTREDERARARALLAVADTLWAP